MINPKEALEAPLILQKRNAKSSCFYLRMCLWIGVLMFFATIFKLKYRDEDFALLSFSTLKEEKAIGSILQVEDRSFHHFHAHKEPEVFMEMNVGKEIGSKSANLAKKFLRELENHGVKNVKIPEKEEAKNQSMSGDEVFQKLKKVEAEISGSRKTRSKLSDEEAKKIHDEQYKKSVSVFHQLSEDNRQNMGDAKMQEVEKTPLPNIEEDSVGFLDKGVLGESLDAVEAAGDEGGGEKNEPDVNNNIGNTGGLDGTEVNTGYVDRLKRANERMEAEVREKKEYAEYEDNRVDAAARARIAAAQAASQAYMATQGVESKHSVLGEQMAYGMAQFNPLAG